MQFTYPILFIFLFLLIFEIRFFFLKKRMSSNLHKINKNPVIRPLTDEQAEEERGRSGRWGHVWGCGPTVRRRFDEVWHSVSHTHTYRLIAARARESWQLWSERRRVPPTETQRPRRPPPSPQKQSAAEIETCLYGRTTTAGTHGYIVTVRKYQKWGAASNFFATATATSATFTLVTWAQNTDDLRQIYVTS